MRLGTKLARLRNRLKLAAAILTGRWTAPVAQRQGELEAILARSHSLSEGRMEADGLPVDLEAVLLHSATAAMEIERLSARYASLASRVASIERALVGRGGSSGQDEPDL